MTRRHWAAVAVIVVVLVAVGVSLRERRPEAPAPAGGGSSVLVLTWGPSLCRVETSASGCRSGRVAGLGNSFLLHGLWPQPRSQQYCGATRGDRDRRPVELPPDVAARVREMMSDPAVAARYQWNKHGSCAGVTEAEYFGIATALAQQAIDVVDPLFDRSVGREVTARSVRDAFDARYGDGAGQRVGLECRGDGVAYEVRLSLPAVVDLRDAAPGLGEALAEGPTVAPGCGRARVP